MTTSNPLPTLLEIQNLETKIKAHSIRIEEEKKRLVHFDRQKDARKDDLEKTHTRIQVLRRELAEQENIASQRATQIEKSKEHLRSVTKETQLKAIEKELAVLPDEKTRAEEKAFELMEEIETLTSEEKDSHTFLEGAVKTMDELNTEVKEHIAAEQDEIDILEKRSLSLRESLPEHIRKKVESVMTRLHFKTPITRVVGDACESCQAVISKLDQNSIFRGTLVTCHNCGRILAEVISGS